MTYQKNNKGLRPFIMTYATLFLLSCFLVNLLVPDKVQAYTQQDCVNVAMNCANRCINSINVKNINVNNIDAVTDACAQKCINEITAYCKDPNNSQPQKQQPQQKTQPTVLEEIPRTAVNGQPFSHNYSRELTDLLGPDSPGCPCSFNLDTMGGFPPMGLILGPDGVLKGTPTGKDSKFRACVKDAGGNTACKVINIDVKKESESELVAPENFRLTELAYNNLTYGKQFQSSQDERVVMKMPDGSLMHMDMGSTITPVSDYEVKSDTGRFMYDYKPASGGGCGPIGQSPTWACRQVGARDATLRVKGTQFAVDTDTYGTNIIVMEGVLSVSDPKGKKTVEVSGGQYTYIAKQGLPTDPQSFDTSQVDFWWKEKTAEQISQTVIGIIVIVAVIIIVFSLLVSIIKRIFRRKKTVPAAAPAAEQINQNAPASGTSDSQVKKKKHHPAFLVLIIFILLLGPILAFYLIRSSQPGGQKEKNSEIEKSIAADERLKDPDLLYASFSSYGLCRNDEGEEGICTSKRYLYLSGKLVTVSGWVGSKDKISTSTIEKQLGKSLAEKVKKQAKDSGLMAKNCGEIQRVDVSWSYWINLDGVKKEFKNPSDECEEIFDTIDNIIDSTADNS